MHMNVSKRSRIRPTFDRSAIERERLNQAQRLRSEERSQSDNFMASQHPPLHSFSLPKWMGSKNHTNNHIRGRGLGGSGVGESSSPSLDVFPRQSLQFGPALPLRHSPLSDSRGLSPMRGFTLESECSWVPMVKSPIMSGKPEGRDLNSDEEKRGDMEKSGHGKKKKTVDQGDDNELIVKTWNLRPRKPLVKPSNANANTSKAGGSAVHEKKAPSVKGTEGNIQPKTAEKKKKEKENDKVKMPKFSISLTNQEIAEDFFVMTGEKLPRRPKKRPKQVQKHLDNIFPGLWLPTITPDAYKVSETQPKG